MSKLVIVGGTGYTGSAIAKEAVRRGHEVTAISRSAPQNPLEGVTYQQIAAAEAPLAGADVVVGALSPRAGSEGTLVETYRALADRAASAGARLVVIGGFSSLRPAPGAPRLAETPGAVPEEYAPEAIEMNAVLTAISETPSELDWVFVSPAAVYGEYTPQGETRGAYRTSGDVALFDENQQSAIGGADFALAVVDEIEASAHHREHIHFAY